VTHTDVEPRLNADGSVEIDSIRAEAAAASTEEVPF